MDGQKNPIANKRFFEAQTFGKGDNNKRGGPGARPCVSPKRSKA
jgi:hypothetical protein